MEVSSIAEQLYFTTIRVETVDSSGDKGVGTSFIFKYTAEKKQYPFLVTNKHVVSGAQKGSLTFTQARDGKPLLGTGYRLDIESFESIWHGHANPNIDVTITPFAPILNHIGNAGANIYFRMIGSELVPSEDDLKQVDAIEEVVFIGYPVGIWDTKNLLPVARKGISASPIAIDFLGEPQFLVDASIFPGSSGSPVFLYNTGMYATKSGGTVVGTRLRFLGIIASVFFQEDVNEIRVRSIPTVDVPVAVSRQMIDLGVVFKASTIREVIEAFLMEKGESMEQGDKAS
jgi:hypothetical protein